MAWAWRTKDCYWQRWPMWDTLNKVPIFRHIPYMSCLVHKVGNGNGTLLTFKKHKNAWKKDTKCVLNFLISFYIWLYDYCIKSWTLITHEFTNLHSHELIQWLTTIMRFWYFFCNLKRFKHTFRHTQMK